MEGNRKFLVPLADGLAVEAVWYGSGTLCVSSQAGCALGCPFCASGGRGLLRNLAAQELVQQLEAARGLGLEPQRVTVSGIGEPLHNPEAVAAFLDLCRRQDLPLSLTTTGSPPARLREFLALPHHGLTLSLHAGTAATYRRLVPAGPGLAALGEVLGEALPLLSRRRRRRIGVNYLLLAGVNDTVEELAGLAAFLRPFPELTLHLLTCNPLPGRPFVSPPPAAVDGVQRRLRQEGMHVRRANRWRRQAQGGCGTLFVKTFQPLGRMC